MRDAFSLILTSIVKLRTAIFLGLISVSCLATIGTSIYMGTLTQRCILNAQFDLHNETGWWNHHLNKSNWIPNILCGNASSAG